MAILWGNRSGGVRYGVEFRASGSTLYADLYIDADAGHNASHTTTPTSASSFKGAYTSQFYVPFNGGTVLWRTWSIAASPGSTYRFAANGSKLPYGGGTPSINVTFKMPAGTPGPPGPLSFENLTATSVTARMTTAPQMNGSNLTGYQYQWATNSGFTQNLRSLTRRSTPFTAASVTGLSPLTQYYFRVRAESDAGYGAWSVTRTVTTAPLQPDTPTGLTAVRHSDGRFDLSWTLVNPDHSSKPVQDVLVYRWDNLTGQYALVATLGKVSAYSDTSTRADRRYRYAVRARNAGGLSGWAYSDYVVTTPAAPTGVVAARSGSDNRVDFTRAASYDTTVEVQRRAGTGSWTALTSLPPGGANFAVHTAPDPATPWTYRVRAVSGTVASAWVESNQVVIIAPPAAPTGLGPGTVSISQAAYPGEGYIRWQHNPVDGTAQTRLQIRHRLQGASTWTVEPERSSAASQWLVANYSNPSLGIAWAAGNSYEWQVRTRGAHASWSPWSGTQLTMARQSPTITLVKPTPSMVHDSSILTVEWSYFDAAGIAQAGWQVTLLDAADNVLGSYSGSGSRTSLTLGERLLDQRTYKVRVSVQSGTGLRNAYTPGVWGGSDPGFAEFTVSYPEPAKAVITPDWQPDNGLVQLQIANGVGSPAAVSNDIYRAILPVDIVEPGMTVWEGASAPIKPAMVWEAPTAPPAGTLRNGELWHDTSTSDLHQWVEAGSDEPLAVIVDETPPPGMMVGQYLLNPVTLDLAVCVGGNHYLFFDPDDGYIPKIWDTDQGAWVPVGEPPRWQLIAENMPPNSGFPDVTAPVRGLILYRADATSALPSTSEGVTANLILPERESDDAIWLSGGPGFGSIGRLPYDPVTSISAGVVDQPQHRFAGRKYPVVFSGEARYKEFTVSGTLVDDSASKWELLELFDLGGTYLYRDPSGERVFCSVSDLKIDRSPNKSDAHTFSFKVTQVDYSEVVI